MSGQKKVLPKESPGKIDFVGKSGFFAVLSIILIIASMFLVFGRGLNYGIDFAGGTEIQVQFKENLEVTDMRQFLEKVGMKGASVQKFGEDNEFLLRFQVNTEKTEKETNKKINEMIAKVTGGLKSSFVDQGAVIRRVDSVGPQIGDELKRNGVLAAFYSLLLILIYVGLRFDAKFSPGAVFALFHDAIITLGVFALLGKEVNVQIMAAVLTIIGYSLNDTIVNFDRIRENMGIFRDKKLNFVINRSINEVLSRTILTSITTLLAILSLYFIAGGVIKDFAFGLGIGVVIGTYSSIYVASPLILVMDKIWAK